MDLVKNLHEEDSSSTESANTAYDFNEFKPEKAKAQLMSITFNEKKAQPKTNESQSKKKVTISRQ